MSTQIYDGLIIKIIDYSFYDQIVTILTNTEIIAFLALGVRKLTSKNRVALQVGNLVEVEIFRARLFNKLSKLKRANTLIQPSILKNDVALVILEIVKEINKISQVVPELLQAIKQTWSFWGRDYNHHIKTFVIFRTLSSYGIDVNLKNCYECNRYDRIQGFSFHQGGYSCVKHTDVPKNLDYLQAIYDLNYNLRKYFQTSPLLNQTIYLEMLNYLREFGSY